MHQVAATEWCATSIKWVKSRTEIIEISFYITSTVLNKRSGWHFLCNTLWNCWITNLSLTINAFHYSFYVSKVSWWRHQMETFSALLALCAGNSPDPGEFPSQRPVTRSFDVFFDMRLYKRLSKQSWGWLFETQSRSLCRHCNGELYVWDALIVLTYDCI